MGVYWILLSLGAIILLASFFEYLSRAIRLPSVLLLITAGVAIKIASLLFPQIAMPVNATALQAMGTIGLVLIVLEESLHLNIEKGKGRIIMKALTLSVISLVATTAAISWAFSWQFGLSLQGVILYAIPLAIISSAVAIPSIAHLPSKKKEFVTYEATFSDIVGVLVFNFILAQEVFTPLSLLSFPLQIGVTLLLSLIASLGVIHFMTRNKERVRTIIVLATLLMLYATGKLFHFSPLILILLFGIIVNNLRVLRNHIANRLLELDEEFLQSLKLMVGEYSFIVKTLFFVYFGYSINFSVLLHGQVVSLALFILMLIYVLRWLVLKQAHKTTSLNDLFIAPRGLITIVLFYALPSDLRQNEAIMAVYSLVILSSIFIMSLGLMLDKDKETPIQG